MPEILKSVDVAGVNLDIYSGPVGVSCSGGADSAVLLYNIMKNKTDDKIFIFTTGNNQRNRLNIAVATGVVERCIQLTGNTNIEHHISYCEVQSFETLFPKLGFYFKHDVLGIIYTGITENPPVEVSNTFKLPITETKRNPGIQKSYLHSDGRIYTPWTNVNKSVIASMYNEDNLINKLFPLTRSCEYCPEDNYFNNIEDPGLGHCGKCWWCEERKWAFGRLK